MARTTASDVSKTLQEDLSMDHQPTGQEVASEIGRASCRERV